MIEPHPAVRNDAVDYFGNPVTFATIQQQHEELVIEAHSRVDVATPASRRAVAVHAVGPGLPAPGAGHSDRTGSRDPAVRLRFAVCAGQCRTRVPTHVNRSCRATGHGSGARPDAAHPRDFSYNSGTTSVSTPVEEVFRLRRGVCQDFAHLELACLRALALPARYVSGYLLTRPPPGKEKLVGSDASHAWVSVWCQEAGWVDLDPDQRHYRGRRTRHARVGPGLRGHQSSQWGNLRRWRAHHRRSGGRDPDHVPGDQGTPRRMTERRTSGLLEGYDSGGFYCELFGAGKHPPATRNCTRAPRRPELAELRRRAQAAERELYNLGITFTVYTEPRADRPDPAIRRHSPRADGRRVGHDRARRHPARNRAQPLHRGHLPRAEDPQGQGRAGGTGARQCELPSADAGAQGALRQLRQHLRHRHRPRRRREVLRARGQCPHAVGRFLRRREPAPDAARLPRPDAQHRRALGVQLRPAAGWQADASSRRGSTAIRRWCCCRPASTTPPISSTCSWPARWACRWSKAATWWSATTASS